MPNEVKIIIKSESKVKEGFDKADHEASLAGEKSAGTYTTAFSKRMESLGQTISDHVSAPIHEGMKKVDREIASVEPKIKKAIEKSGEDSGPGMARKLADKFLPALSGFLTGGIPLILTAIGAALAVGLPLVLVGVGSIGLAAGVIGLRKDPKVVHAFKGLKEDLGGVLKDFSAPFRGPLLTVLERFGSMMDKLRPKFKEMGKELGPVFERVGTGLVRFIEKLMPGILAAMEASKPLFDSLAVHLPKIGEALTEFFQILSDHSDDADIVFNSLLTIIETLIPVIARIVVVCAQAFIGWRDFIVGAIRLVKDWHGNVSLAVNAIKSLFLRLMLYVVNNVFAPMLGAAVAAFSWVPGLGGKLHQAQNAFSAFRRNVNNELNRIHDKTVTIRIRQVFSVIGERVGDAAAIIRSRMADGGIKGAATGAISGGWTWVGERGPELAKLPPGTSVRTAGDSARMASSQQHPGWIMRAELDPMLEHSLVGALLKALRLVISNQGGNVQAVLGSGY